MKHDECCGCHNTGFAEPVETDFVRLTVEYLELAAVSAGSRGFCL